MHQIWEEETEEIPGDFGFSEWKHCARIDPECYVAACFSCEELYDCNFEDIGMLDFLDFNLGVKLNHRYPKLLCHFANYAKNALPKAL